MSRKKRAKLKVKINEAQIRSRIRELLMEEAPVAEADPRTAQFIDAATRGAVGYSTPIQNFLNQVAGNHVSLHTTPSRSLGVKKYKVKGGQPSYRLYSNDDIDDLEELTKNIISDASGIDPAFIATEYMPRPNPYSGKNDAVVATVFTVDPKWVPTPETPADAKEKLIQLAQSGQMKPAEDLAASLGIPLQIASIPMTFAGGSAKKNLGYKYEEDAVNMLNDIMKANPSGFDFDDFAYQGTDATKSDVFLRLGPDGEEVGLEYKAKGGRFGQPILSYDYASQQWIVPSNSKSPDNAGIIAYLLNNAPAANKKANDKWILGMRLAIGYARYKGKRNPKTKKRYTVPEIKALIAQEVPEFKTGVVPSDLYKAPKGVNYWRSKFKLAVAPAVTPVPVQTLVDYYQKKGAGYIQLQQAGLYHLVDDFMNLGSSDFSTAVAKTGITPTVKPELNTSGDNKVIRATMEFLGGDFTKMPAADFSLDAHGDKEEAEAKGDVVRAFIDRFSKEDLESMQKDAEDGQVDWDLYAHHEPLGNLIKESLLLEELTKTDKKTIERMVRKQIKRDMARQKEEYSKEMKKLRDDLAKIVAKEVTVVLKDKVTREDIADITKDILKKLYRELSFWSPNVIDKLKLTGGPIFF